MTLYWEWKRPATMHLIYTGARAASFPVTTEFNGCYGKLLGLLKDETVFFYCDYARLIEHGKRIVSDLMDKDYYKEKMLRWEHLCKELERFNKKFEKINLKELNRDELRKLYSEFDDTYFRWWSFAQVVEPIVYYCEEELKKIGNDFNLLSQPTKISFTRQEEIELEKIAQEAKSTGIEHVKDKIIAHSKKYFWLENNFHDTKTLKADYFQKKVEGLMKTEMVFDDKNRLGKIQQEKERAMKGFSEKSRFIVKLVDEFMIFQDIRKKYTLWSDFVIDSFSKEFSRRFKIDYNLIRFLTAPMAKKMLETGKVETETLMKIKDCCFLEYYEEKDQVDMYFGEEAKKKHKKFYNADYSSEELEGLTANYGRAQGKARVILDPRKISEIVEGEILVTSMTTPDFVVAMKKAAAIVTDEGGITCHAAIISRELGIPCIIGTKKATELINTGDLLDVKANHGLVIIKEKTEKF